MNLFAFKIVFLGTFGLVAGFLMLSSGTATGILAVALGVVTILIGGRNIYDRSPLSMPECTAQNVSHGFERGKPLEGREVTNACGAKRTVGATLLVVLGSLAFLGFGIYLKQQDIPGPPRTPPRPHSPTALPNRTVEDLILAFTEATPEDYTFYRTLRQHMSVQRYKDVIRYIESTETRPRMAAWLLYLGHALNETGQHQRAVDILSSFVELQSLTNVYDLYRCPTLYHRARAFVEVEQFEKAVEDLTRLIDEHPTSREALLLRAEAYAHLGIQATAETDATMAPRTN